MNEELPGDFLPLAPPKMWTRGFLLLFGIITLLQLVVIRESAAATGDEFSLLTWLIPAVVALAIISLRKLILPSRARVIRFHDDQVEFPRTRNSRRTSTARYEDIRTVVPLASRGQPALVIDTPGRVHIFVASDFPHPELWRVLWSQLMQRIRTLPDARARLQSMRDLANLSQKTSELKPTFTKRLFWVITGVYAIQYFLAPPVQVLHFLDFGANSSVLVFEANQWWRVITANLLHGNFLHYAVNGFALYFLGTYSERLLGVSRTIILILATGITGAAFSLIGAPLFSVGISTAIYGLLGAYLAIHLRFGNEIPPPYRQSRTWWIVILGLNGLLSIGVPMIDGWGHFGGFIFGLAITGIMLAGQKTFQPRPPAPSYINILAAILVALYAGAATLAVGYALSDHPEDEILIAQTLVDRAEQEEPLLLLDTARRWTEHVPPEERSQELNRLLIEMERQARIQLSRDAE